MSEILSRAIVVAAGRAVRLRPLTDETPKCLLPVGGRPILQWILDALLAHGFTYPAIVVGFHAERIRQFVRATYPSERIRFFANPYFERTNNAYSLLLARPHCEDRDGRIAQGFLLSDSDILFDPSILTSLRERAGEDCAAVRVRGTHDEEEIRVSVNADATIASIGKDVPMAQMYGESIGLEVFTPETAQRLFQTLERRVRSGEGRTEFYEASFQELIRNGTRIHAVDIGDRPVVEIDTPDDLAHAHRLAETMAGIGKN